MVEIEAGFVVGTDQGTLELYSHRLDILSTHQISKTDIIRLYTDSNNSINVITGDSVVYLFDPISCESHFNIHFGTNVIVCFDPHPLIRHLVAYGSTDQSIKICQKSNTDDEFNKLQSIRYHDGFLGQRLGNINKLIWHPERIILGTVTSESFVSIYGMNNKQE